MKPQTFTIYLGMVTLLGFGVGDLLNGRILTGLVAIFVAGLLHSCARRIERTCLRVR
jgi:hypothetical protein